VNSQDEIDEKVAKMAFELFGNGSCGKTVMLVFIGDDVGSRTLQRAAVLCLLSAIQAWKSIHVHASCTTYFYAGK